MNKVAIVLLLLFARPVDAADPVLNAGVFEVMTLPDLEHVAPYGYVGGSVIIPMIDDLVLIPGLNLAFSPNVEGEAHWGLMGTAVGSYALNNVSTLDGIFTLLHDQVGGDFGGAALSAGLGVGYTQVLGKISVSGSLNLIYGLVTASGAILVPLLNVGYAL
jgi:hypothetical protein